MGFERVFSNNLGDPIGISSALVRKDFSTLNIEGNKRGGYDIHSLIQRLDQISGSNIHQHAILVGCGHIGTALLKYNDFRDGEIQIVAGFDKNPLQEQNKTSIPVYNISELSSFVKKNNIRVAIIATPESETLPIFKELKELGIKGFLNFASTDLKCSPECNRNACKNRCVINNINISLELEHIFSQINLVERG